jgi:hypothetical protein
MRRRGWAAVSFHATRTESEPWCPAVKATSGSIRSRLCFPNVPVPSDHKTLTTKLPSESPVAYVNTSRLHTHREPQFMNSSPVHKRRVGPSALSSIWPCRFHCIADTVPTSKDLLDLLKRSMVDAVRRRDWRPRQELRT